MFKIQLVCSFVRAFNSDEQTLSNKRTNEQEFSRLPPLNLIPYFATENQPEATIEFQIFVLIFILFINTVTVTVTVTIVHIIQ